MSDLPDVVADPPVDEDVLAWTGQRKAAREGAELLEQAQRRVQAADEAAAKEADQAAVEESFQSETGPEAASAAASDSGGSDEAGARKEGAARWLNRNLNPWQGVKGAVAGVEQTALAAFDVVDAASEFQRSGELQIGGPAGPALTAFGLIDEMMSGGENGDFSDNQRATLEALIPTFAEPEGGSLVYKLGQFLAPFTAAGKLPGIAQLAASGRAGQLTASAIQGAAADFAAFAPTEERLANFLTELDSPLLNNAFSQWLAADPNDSAMEGRLKNAVEGLGLGVATDLFFSGLKLAGRAIRARMQLPEAVTDAQIFADEADKVGRQVEILREQLGDPEDVAGPLVRVAEAPAGAAADGAVRPQDYDPEAVADALVGGGTDAAGRAAEAVPRGTLGEQGSEIMVNWARIDSPDDIRAAIQDMADLGSESIEAARRGRQTWADTRAEASAVDAWEALRNRGKGGLLNAGQMTAARELWTSSARKTLDLARAVRADPSPMNQVAFRKMLAVHHAIQTEVIGARTEVARSLASMRMPVGDTLLSGARLEDLVQEATTHTGHTQALAERLVMSEATGRIDVADAMVYGAPSTKTADAVAQLWYFSLLSGPHTHARNFLSNISVLPLTVLERKVGSLLSRTVGSGEMVDGEAAALAFGQIQGIRDAFRISAAGRRMLREFGETAMSISTPAKRAQMEQQRQAMAEGAEEFGGFWRSLATGESGFGIGKVDQPRLGAFSAEKLEIDPQSPLAAVANVVDAVTMLPSRALAAGDEIFKTANYRGELNAQAARQATKEVQSGAITKDAYLDRVTELVNNPSESMRLLAQRSAQTNTFTNAPENTRVWQAMQSFGRIPGVGKLVLPFTRTPYNLATFAFRRTPLGFFARSWRDDVFRRGSAHRDMALTQMATGTALLGMFYDMALSGDITGDGPADHRQRQQLRRQGVQPRSVRFKVGPGDDDYRYFSFRGLDPIGAHLGLAANLAEIISSTDADLDDPDSDVSQLVTATVLASMAQVTSANYMQGVADLVEALGDPTRYGESYIERLVGSVVPTGVAQVARTSDPMIREVESMGDAIRARTPGLSADLPARRDAWGRALSRRSSLGPQYDALSPMYARDFAPQPIDKELDKIGVFIATPSTRVTFDRAGSINLDNFPGAYSRWLKMAGQEIQLDFGAGGKKTMLDTLNTMVSGTSTRIGRAYADERMNDPAREDLIRSIITKYREVAKPQLLEKFPALRNEVTRRQEERSALLRK